MSFLKEFREFAVKGNVMDLAIGVVIGYSVRQNNDPRLSAI